MDTAFQTGIALIDDEHARLIALKRQLGQAIAAGHVAAYAEILFELVELMAEHFIHEESLMVGLPASMVQPHKKDHADMSFKVMALMNRVPPGTTAIAPAGDIAAVIEEWLHEHIQRWDLPLANALRG
jgi:hemerythrin